MSECPICGRRSLEGHSLCRYHEMARDNLNDAFEAWKHAEGVSWTEYLNELLNADATGSWVREVIEYIRSQGDSSEH
jgi:hypothetical protein